MCVRVCVCVSVSVSESVGVSVSECECECECESESDMAFPPTPSLFFFFALVTGPRRSLSLKLSDTRGPSPAKPFSSICVLRSRPGSALITYLTQVSFVSQARKSFATL